MVQPLNFPFLPPSPCPRSPDCIMTWLGTRDKENVCPLCRAPWDMDMG